MLTVVCCLFVYSLCILFLDRIHSNIHNCITETSTISTNKYVRSKNQEEEKIPFVLKFKNLNQITSKFNMLLFLTEKKTNCL